MVNWALMLVFLATIVALLSFGGIAGGAAGIVQLLFFIYLMLLVVSAVVFGLRSGQAAAQLSSGTTGHQRATDG